MECPNCKAAISMLDMSMLGHRETDGLQITFQCEECEKVYFAILIPRTFVEENKQQTAPGPQTTRR